jgi:hypothetical protein
MVKHPFLQQDIRLALWALGRDASIDLGHINKDDMRKVLSELRAEMHSAEAKMMAGN